jgi:hypothetical protein
MSGYDHEPKHHTFFLAVILQIRNLSSLSSRRSLDLEELQHRGVAAGVAT